MKHLKRIYLSMAGLALLVAVTTGGAYALFSSQASLSGLQMTTGSALLQVGSSETELHSGAFTPAFNWTNLYPGYTNQSTFYLKNASTAPIALALKGQLVGTSGDWEALKTVVTMRVMKAGSSSSTGYKTLADWSADGGLTLPGGNLPQNETRGYTLDVQVATKYADGTLIGDEIGGKALNSLSLQLTGTQD